MFEAFSAEVVKIRSCIPEMSRGALADLATSLGQARGALDALEASVASAVDSLGDNGPGASVILRSASRCSQREADKRARRAAGLSAMPNTAEALSMGHITSEHADALVRAAEETSPEAVDQSELVGKVARRPADLATRDTREWARRHRLVDDSQTRHERQLSRRKFMVFEADDMLVVHGEFDLVSGTQFEARLDAETNRLFQLDGGRGVAGDVRTNEQRRADALISLVCGGGSPGGDGPQARGPRHQIMIVAETGVVTGSRPDGRSEIIGSGTIPKSVLERLACNSELLGMVLSGDGEPLWHGRKVRLTTDAQLRGIIVRDQGCVICGKKPRWCEAHHVVPWQGPGRGPTDIDNLVLICSHHHHLVHDHRWRLVRSGVGQWSIQPPDDPP